jgi:hypothetical protein
MNAEPTRSDDDLPEPESYESAGSLRPLGGHLGKVMAHLQETFTQRQARAKTQASEPEEKPFVLPLVDEEELAKVADPQEREERRQEKIRMYKEHPDALRHYTEISERLKAERKKLLRLPVIPQETRPAVNVICNSALFAAVQGKDRQLLNDAHLDTQDGVEIIFSGEQFNQDDHDVLMQLVYLASQHELGEPITVSAHSLLKALGRGTSGKEHDQLKAEIKRLVKGTIQLKTKRFDYIGHLIDDAQQDKETKFWMYRANATLQKFYDVNNYTLIDWESRKALKGKDLARWLQLQLASHAHPFPMKVETIRRLSGSRTKTLFHFREKLRIALNDLKANGSITSWQIDENDKAHVDRGDAISASQQRHLAKPANRRRLPKPQG